MLNRSLSVTAEQAAIMTLGVLLVILWPLMPLQDLPDWYLQAQLFQDLVSARLPPAYSFIGAVPPNALTTVGLAALGALVGMDLAARMWVAGAAIALPLAARALLNTGIPCPAAKRAPLLFLFAYPLLHGNANSALGVSMFMWFLSRLCCDAERQALPGPWLCVGAPLLLYVTHGIAFAMWSLAILTIPSSLISRRRLWFGLLPSIACGLHFALSKPAEGAPLITWSLASPVDWLRYKLDTLYKQLAPLPLFDPFPPGDIYFWFAVVVNYTIAAFLVVWAISAVRGSWRIHNSCDADESQRSGERGRRLLATGLGLAFIAAPEGVLGLVNPGERLVLPFLFVALSLPPPTGMRLLPLGWLRRHAVGLTAVALIQLGWIGVRGYEAARAMDTIRRAPVPKSTRLSLLHENRLTDSRVSQRPEVLLRTAALPRHYPLLRAVMYTAHARATAVPIFETGLFRAKATGTLLRSLDERCGTGVVLAVGHAPRLAAIASAAQACSVTDAGPHHVLLNAKR